MIMEILLTLTEIIAISIIVFIFFERVRISNNKAIENLRTLDEDKIKKMNTALNDNATIIANTQKNTFETIQEQEQKIKELSENLANKDEQIRHYKNWEENDRKKLRKEKQKNAGARLK